MTHSGGIKKIGLLGGSFNPPHKGHKAMAAAAISEYKLDEVWFLVAARPPHKSQQELGDFQSRMFMANQAVSKLHNIKACAIESEMKGVTYTYRTIKEIKKRYPETKFYFIMGADTVTELAIWKNPDQVLKLATPIIIPRTGFGIKDVKKLSPLLTETQLTLLKNSYLGCEKVDISSSIIREKIKNGENIDHLVEPSVADYIRSQNLYK